MTASLKQDIDITMVTAQALARHFINRAAEPDATEVDKVLANTATLIIRKAEMAADCRPREDLDQASAEAKELGEDLQERIAEVMKQEAARGNTDPSSGPIREAIGHAVAVLDASQARFTRSLDEHRLSAWQHAVDELSTLDVPLSRQHATNGETVGSAVTAPLIPQKEIHDDGTINEGSPCRTYRSEEANPPRGHGHARRL